MGKLSSAVMSKLSSAVMGKLSSAVLVGGRRLYKLVFTGNFSFQTNKQTDRQKKSAGVELRLRS